MASYQQIIEAAYAKSMKNQPDQIATEADELMDQTYRLLSGLFMVASRFAPTRFAGTSQVAYSSGWARPSTADNIFRVEKTDGTEVVVVPFDDRAAEPSKPCVYEYGGVFYLASGTGLTTGDDLVFYFSQIPAAPAAVSEALPTVWDDNYDELLILDVALYLIIKDGREEEEMTTVRERNRWASRFLNHLENHTSATRGRFGSVKRNRRDMVQELAGVLQPGSEALT